MKTNASVRKVSRALIAAFVLATAAAPPALADALGDAKAAGWVGERSDGSLGIVTASAPASAQALVDEVNAKRLERYRAIAKKNGTRIDAVAALAGQKLIARTPSGEYVMDAQGKWSKKP